MTEYERCTLDGQFDALIMATGVRVQKANDSLPENKTPYSLTVSKDNPPSNLWITGTRRNGEKKIVHFSKRYDDNAIYAESDLWDKPLRKQFHVHWNTRNSRCELRIEKKILLLEAVITMTLSPLFLWFFNEK